MLRYRRKADADAAKPLHLTVPAVAAPAGVTVETLSPVQTASGATALQKVDGGDDVLPAPPPELNTYAAAAELAANYHLATHDVLAALRSAYGVGSDIPDYHLAALGQQIEAQRSDYEEHFEEIEVAIALVKADGFEKSERAGQPVYTARISFAKEREPLYLTARDTPDAAHALASSFHYEGYNFDSKPEAEFLKWALAQLQADGHQIEGVWFTDWRAVVDCILIDTQYDGQVFSVALADVPERKQDLVNGRYELPAPPAGSTVAVKIIDMLGEELVIATAV